MSTSCTEPQIKIGVGLRHAHIEAALSSPALIDFIEVHAENYFSEGGALHRVLQDMATRYPISIHATAMGLGSATPPPEHYLNELITLNDAVDAYLISDHAAFGWGILHGKTIHGGDLLPIVYSQESLAIMIERVDQIQQLLGRQILVENLSAYLDFSTHSMSEPEFLVELAGATGCGLLIDLNNILVNAFNERTLDGIASGDRWLKHIPKSIVGEIHLAGFSPPLAGHPAIDDHAQPVSQEGWALYQLALKQFGAIPTLIEWDNQLPDWDCLLDQVKQARGIANKVLHCE